MNSKKYNLKKLLLLFLLFSLTGCGNRDKEIDVIELGDDGTPRIKFIINAQYIGALGGGWYTYEPQLKILSSKREWLVADSAYKNRIKHTQLLFSDENHLVKFENYMKTKRWLNLLEIERSKWKSKSIAEDKKQMFLETSDRFFEWDIYISPEIFTKSEYNKILNLIQNNLALINSTFNSPVLEKETEKITGEPISYGRKHQLKPTITSIAYYGRDNAVIKLQHNIEKNKALMIYPGGDVCWGDSNEDVWKNIGKNNVGRLSTDGKKMFIFFPRKIPNKPFVDITNSSDLINYIRHFETNNGESILQYFEPSFVADVN